MTTLHQELLDIGGGQESPNDTWGRKKLIQLHDITNWAYCELPLRGIRLKTPGRDPGIPLKMVIFHYFTM